jgi:hypothetical protein
MPETVKAVSAAIFPIHLPCHENGWSAYHYRPQFLTSKPDHLTWFAYDTIIHSETDVEFVVYDMADNFYGGRGKKIASFRTLVPRGATARDIDNQIVQLAIARRAKELREAEAAIISGYADEIRSTLNLA